MCLPLLKLDASAASMLKTVRACLDPTGATFMAQGLCEQGFELVSTGGSAAALEKASLPVQRVEQLTGFPEMLDGTNMLPFPLMPIAGPQSLHPCVVCIWLLKMQK